MHLHNIVHSLLAQSARFRQVIRRPVQTKMPLILPRADYLIILFVLASGCAAKSIPAFAGPYVTIVERVLSCDDEAASGKLKLYLRASHFNRYNPSERQNVSGNVTVFEPFDDAVWMDIRIDVRANNEWKKNAYVLKFPNQGCSRFRAFLPSFFKVMYKGVSLVGACSVPVGVYVFDEPVDWSFPNVPVFPYGHYLATMNGGRGNQKIIKMCSQYELRIIPKSS
ncbi:uncharacterized protein LOC117641234 [Thrips palmi]|uniref:Uncharacterized protein LOC117641234 n=1 Tax=Thrips palmi TaxID=161013 RepID=A0A6P8YBU7_THRPL|nr:uncharacterized protein LOC117641234 [Thrips palmi]